MHLPEALRSAGNVGDRILKLDVTEEVSQWPIGVAMCQAGVAEPRAALTTTAGDFEPASLDACE
jgi:hypothetical protein